MSKTGVNGLLLTEAKYINLSLHYLEQVLAYATLPFDWSVFYCLVKCLQFSFQLIARVQCFAASVSPALTWHSSTAWHRGACGNFLPPAFWYRLTRVLDDGLLNACCCQGPYGQFNLFTLPRNNIIELGMCYCNTERWLFLQHLTDTIIYSGTTFSQTIIIRHPIAVDEFKEIFKQCRAWCHGWAYCWFRVILSLSGSHHAYNLYQLQSDLLTYLIFWF